MKTALFATLAVVGGTPQLLVIIFWVLLLLWLIGAFTWRTTPAWPHASNVVLIIELAILGWSVFRFGM